MMQVTQNQLQQLVTNGSQSSCSESPRSELSDNSDLNDLPTKADDLEKSPVLDDFMEGITTATMKNSPKSDGKSDKSPEYPLIEQTSSANCQSFKDQTRPTKDSPNAADAIKDANISWNIQNQVNEADQVDRRLNEHHKKPTKSGSLGLLDSEGFKFLDGSDSDSHSNSNGLKDKKPQV